MGKSAVSSSSSRLHQRNPATGSASGSGPIPGSALSHSSSSHTSESTDPLAARNSLASSNFPFNPGRQDSISSLLNNYQTSSSGAYTLTGRTMRSQNQNANQQQNQNQNQIQNQNENENHHNQINRNQNTSQLPPSQSQAQSHLDSSSYPSYYLNHRDSQIPIRPRGDSIFLPPPISSSHPYDGGIAQCGSSQSTLNVSNPYSSRSNSIFSSLIQIPGSARNSISEGGGVSTTNKGYNSSGGAASISNISSSHNQSIQNTGNNNNINMNVNTGSNNNANINNNSANATSSSAIPSGSNNSNNPNSSGNSVEAPIRGRSLSIFPSLSQGMPEVISLEDIETLLSKESLGNILAWNQQQQQQQQDPKTPAGARSKFGSLDMSMWSDNSNNSGNNVNSQSMAGCGSIGGFNGSLSDFIAGMISNGSIDLSNMSNEQRRDSILKIISDSQNLRNQRIPSDSANDKNPNARISVGTDNSGTSMGGTTLREDIFDHNKFSVGSRTKDMKDNHSSIVETRTSPGNNTNLNVPGSHKGHLSPTSSMSSRSSAKYNDEPQSPKTSPTGYTINMNTRQGHIPPQQQDMQSPNQHLLPQPPIPSQRIFQNYQNVSLHNQNQNQNENQAQTNQNLQFQTYTNPAQGSMTFGNTLSPGITMRNQLPAQQQQANYYSNPQPAQVPYQQQQQYLQQNYPVRQQATSPQMSKPRTSKPRRNSNSRDAIPDQSLKSPIESGSNEGNLVPAQQYVKSEDGRPLLGATKIDQLMLVIQARDKGITSPIQQAPDGSILAAPDYSLSRDKSELDNGVLPRPISLVGGVDKPSKAKIKEDEGSDDEESRGKRRKNKNQQCPYCFKYFTQSTHLEVHIRSHIGYKPFECNYCHKKFTQGGNLRTHLRLHTGEKPFTCDICNRQFNRKGNLGAHKLTHENLKPYECKLDGCDKSFTQLGNLKSHQNRFHLSTLNHLTQKLAELSGSSIENLPPDEKDLLMYFKDLYRNSNKGIRGRGKAKLSNADPGAATSNSPDNNQFNLQSQSPQSQQQNLQALPRQQDQQQGSPEYSQSQHSLDFMNPHLAGSINGYQG